MTYFVYVLLYCLRDVTLLFFAKYTLGIGRLILSRHVNVLKTAVSNKQHSFCASFEVLAARFDALLLPLSASIKN